MSLDDTTIRDLIEFTDEHGVLSIYAGHTPERAADPQPTAPIEIRNQIKALRTELAETDEQTAKAVDARLDEISADIDALLDPKAHGRGRVLFVGVDSGRQQRVSLQIPFKERVIHRERAYVRPLVAAHDEGRAAGIVVVSRSGARVLRWAVGEVTELETYGFTPSGDLARQKTGPTPAQPQHAGHGLDHKERFEERIDEQRSRFLRDVADEVKQRVAEHGWDRLVLSASPKLRDEMSGLLADDGYRLLLAERSWEEAAPHEIADAVGSLLRSVHLDRERELTELAVERALGGNAGAVGLRNVTQALNEGRVAHLLYRDDLQAEGVVSEEGTVHPRVEGAVAEAGLEFTHEPLLVERMIAAAVATDAEVTSVDPEVAHALDQHDGVAALLRW